MTSSDTARVLKLDLHGTTVGYLTGYLDGRNQLIFSPEFRADSNRPTFSLITHPAFPKADSLMSEPWMKRQKLHPILSNLLPEGALRDFLALRLKLHTDNEFELLAALGQDLPGALLITPVDAEDIPSYVLDGKTSVHVDATQTPNKRKQFSLAGVQMKFSMREKGDRYQIAESGELGDWIIKTPSTTHRQVPLNEFTAMRLAELAGVNIPEIRLVDLNQLEQLPPINLPNETYAFAIQRFDRRDGQRVHMEDFAQILVKYPQDKYRSANYQQIAKVLYQYSGDGLGDVQQLARRLLVNILLANGDAHLKNWSVLYPDAVTPFLSPAYDIVTTRVYMGDEREFALNLGKGKDWYQATLAQFEHWAAKADLPWRAIRPHLFDTMERARSLWPATLKELPMDGAQKVGLSHHWGQLHPDFRIG